MDLRVSAGLVLRPAGPSDAGPLARMFGRCSADTVARRFHGRVGELPRAYLEEALTADPCLHDALVVEDAGTAVAGARTVVALGSARRLDDPARPVAEVALLVEDARQRHGLGSLLLAVLAERARRRGVTALRCDVLAQAEPLVGTVRRILGPATTRREGFVVHVEVGLQGAEVPCRAGRDDDAR
ncbi:N-acetyltransferase family protein [Geodermatophilus sp. SYSU D00815]